MNRTYPYPYFLLGFALFCWISVPKPATDRVRSFAVASLAPVWKVSERIFLGRSYTNLGESAEITRLQLENQTLRNQVESAYEWILSEQRIGEEIAFLKNLFKEMDLSSDSEMKAAFKRRADQLRNRLYHQLASFPAQVVYRDPSSWSSSLWVNAGEEDNLALGRTLIAKNSPVVSGGALIGVVDFVGKKQSRVRLITDSGLSPAVRAIRGGSQGRELLQLLQTLLLRLGTREDLFLSIEEKNRLLTELQVLQARIGKSWEDAYLAKGELHGSSVSFWRSRGMILKGIGFNYDYGDEEGPARDLTNGRPVGSSTGDIQLLKEGDLLMTSGLDGVFPPGLLVAAISKIGPLKEGAYAYELEARPAAHHLNDLQSVFILPSLSSE